MECYSSEQAGLMKPFNTFKYRGNTETGAISTLNVDAYTYIVDYVGSLFQPAANIGFYSDGTIVLYAYGTGSTWHNVPAVGVGSSFWAIVTLTSGSLSSGTSGSRVSLADGQMWSVTTTGTAAIRNKSAVGTIELWDAASGGNMVSSGTFSLSATMEANRTSDDSGGGSGGGKELHPPGQGQPIQRF
jgi:hypothetical protein